MVCYLSKAQIQERVENLGKEIDCFLDDGDCVIFNLIGSLHFASDLLRSIKKNVIVDSLELKSYNGCERKKIRVQKSANLLVKDLHNKKVLLIDDILDSGNTLSFMKQMIKNEYSPKEVRSCVLLDKKLSQEKADYVGFEIKNEFVVGYGLDYKGLYRNLQEIFIFSEDLCQ